MKRTRQALISAGLLIAAATVSAETMTCGSWIVSPEVTVAELLKKCGPPTSKEISTEDVRAHGPSGAVKVGDTTTEKWIYQRGSLSFTMVVTIVDGEVKSIESIH